MELNIKTTVEEVVTDFDICYAMNERWSFTLRAGDSWKELKDRFVVVQSGRSITFHKTAGPIYHSAEERTISTPATKGPEAQANQGQGTGQSPTA